MHVAYSIGLLHAALGNTAIDTGTHPFTQPHEGLAIWALLLHPV